MLKTYFKRKGETYMTPGQYKPFNHKYKKIPLIVYPVKDENPLVDIFDPSKTNSIQKHLDKLYQMNAFLNKGNYHILFVWNMEGNRMTDVWIHNINKLSNTSGPLLDCITFNNLKRCTDAGIASGDSILTLGREEELRRTVKSLKDYIDRKKHVPNFPKGMTPTKSFYSSTCKDSLRR